MTINYTDNVIELYSSDVDISHTEHGIQIVFNGENDLDYFLVQQHFDEGDYVSVFYTEGCDTSGHWTFIHATLDKESVTFSVDKIPIRIHLNITSSKDRELRETLRNLMGLIGKLTERDK